MLYLAVSENGKTMKGNEFQKIGVVGAGKMGTDIFYFLNDFNYNLIWICETLREKESLLKLFHRRLRRMKKYGLIDDDVYNNKIDSTIISSDIKNLSFCDIIIEAITEDINIKKKLLNKIDSVAKEECIIASNSSSIIPTKLCASINRRDKFIGLHFFYPIKLKNIVELTKTKFSSKRTIKILETFLKNVGKFFLILPEEEAYVLNRVVLAFQAEAFCVYEEKILSFQEIDELIKENIFSIGVFDFFDSVGIDVMLASIKEYTENIAKKDFFLPMIKRLRKLKEKNRLGQKTGHGFYSYNLNHESKVEKKASSFPISIEDYKKDVVDRLLFIYLNSVYKFLEKGICEFEEIEYSIKEYLGVKKGPIELAKEIGFNIIHSKLLQYYKNTGYNNYYPSLMFKKSK